MITIKCKQLVENDELSDGDDRQDLALGKDGVMEVNTSCDTVEEALDLFHREQPIGCLEDYEITTEET
jgi:hypothetical protein